MNSILIGNGINIQFGGKEYTNENIIRRAINNTLSGSFPEDDYPSEIMPYIYELKKIFPEVLKGQFDKYAYVDFEKKALKNLQRRYNKRHTYSVYQIGIEDYFLIHDLLCSKYEIHNPESYHIRGVLKRFFLDSIYNYGNVQNVYQLFPNKFETFLKKYSTILTTNYDHNLENMVTQKVLHLHGSFDVLDEVYDMDSFRNKITDQPGKDFEINETNRHLYSNALMAYGGFIKAWSLKQHERTNSALSSFSEGYKADSEITNEIEQWKKSSNYILQNLYEGIKLKMENPDLNFKENYHLDKLDELRETLTFLGLSPNNDSHLFNPINKNNKIEEIKYYCYDQDEAQIAKNIFPDKKIHILDVNELWETLI